MTNYEVMFILDPALEDDKKDATENMDAACAHIDERLTPFYPQFIREVTKEDIWGTKKLAYPIQKKNEGYYAVVEFQAGTELPKELDRRLKISDACIRHIIVNKDEK